MADRTIPFHDPAFIAMIERAAGEFGFSSATVLAGRLAALGALEDLDWFLLRDITGLCNARDPETVLLLILLLQARNRGSLCLATAPDHLAARLADLGPERLPAGLGRRLADWLDTAPAVLLSRGDAAAAPLVLDPATGLLYFQRLFLAESTLKSILGERLALPPRAPDPKAVAAILHEVTETRAPRRSGQPVRLNDEQRLAVLCGLLRPLTLVTGGPGTGKTSLVTALLRCLVRGGTPAGAIRLAAPTGRAAQRLAEAIRNEIDLIAERDAMDQSVPAIESTTIHRLLSRDGKSGTFRHNRRNPLPYDCLVVDEASMLSVDLAAALLEALPADCRLVLIGDRDQLPSVDAGAVLGDLVPAGPSFSPAFAAFAKQTAGLALVPGGSGRFRDAAVFLRQSYRSEKAIIEYAKHVNNGNAAAASLPVFTPDGGAEAWAGLAAAGDCLRMPGPATAAERERLCEAWILERMMGLAPDGNTAWETLLAAIAAAPAGRLEDSPECRELFRHLASARILTTLRHGPAGCEQLNRRLATHMKERCDADREGPLFHGLPILVKENNHSRKLFNGDIGIVVRSLSPSGRACYRVVFDRPERMPVLVPDELPAWEPAFAITVHKSQGSEYGEVLLVMPEDPAHTLNTREILYTGITRARKRVVIMGENAVIDTAARTPAQRESGLRLWSAATGPTAG